MSKRKLAQEEADQIERSGADSELWRQEPVEIEARPSRTSVLSLRLPTAEFHALVRAARSVNDTLSDHVPKANMLRQRYEQTAATINAAYTQTTQTGVEETVVAWRTTTAAPPAFEPSKTTFVSVSS